MKAGSEDDCCKAIGKAFHASTFLKNKVDKYLVEALTVFSR
jgi:hypothetical protein